MKRTAILSLIAAASALAAQAGLNNPADNGYIARGLEMLDARNYTGAIDQLGHIDRQGLSPQQLEEVDWALARAAFGNSGAAAMTHFKRFLAVYPYSIHRQEALMRVADCLFTRSYPEALAAYRQVDRGALNLALRDDLDYRMAYCLMQVGELDEADTLFAGLLRTKEYGAAARFYRGYIAYAHGNYGEAETLLAAASSNVAPGNMAPYYLAQIYYRNKRYDKALNEARTLLRRNDAPATFRAEAERIAGESLFCLDRPDEAIPYLRRYIAATAEPLPSAQYILGRAEYEEGDFDNAIGHLKAATDDTDAMAQSAYLYIGQALMHTGDTRAALLAFDQAAGMDFDPEVQETAFYNYAVAGLQGGRVPFGSSVATLEQFLSRYPSSPRAAQVQEYIVTGYLTDNDYDHALASINRMSRPSQRVLGAKQHILYTLGSRQLAAGDGASALPLLREADALASYATPLMARENRLALGEALYRTGDYDAAPTALLDYVRHTPATAENMPVARYDLGYTRFAQKRYADAATNFEHVTDAPGALAPQVVADAYNRLADTYYYRSDFDRAEKYYDKAYSTYPDAGDYSLFQKGVMQGYRRNHRAKIATLAQMMERFPSSALVPDAMLETTESQIQTGANDDAIATYRMLVATYPGTAQGRKGHLQLAQTLLNSGRRKQAVETYKEIITGYPTSGEAVEASEALKRLAAEDGTLDEYMNFLAGVENAPKMDIAEADKLSFDAADRALVADGNAARMEKYLADFPEGAYRARALEGLMQYYQAAGKDAEAYRCAAALIDGFPDNAATEGALVVKAQADYEAGRGESALRAWKQLEQRASTASRLNAARMGIMRVGRETGDFELVLRAADDMLASSTLGSENRNEAIFSKGSALEATGHRAEAREQWKSIAGDTDDIYGAKAAYYLAQSLLDDGHAAEARTAADALTSSGTPHAYWLARGFIVLSDVYAAEGKTFEAREYLKALRDNYPGTETDIFEMIDSRLK
ncbi:MAG: tetratricopeptide repeat protein [Muribaculaceae bacterium]|nr:tetratricopeptide repeat protein [Muribaculaceae bacterium]